MIFFEGRAVKKVPRGGCFCWKLCKTSTSQPTTRRMGIPGLGYVVSKLRSHVFFGHFERASNSTPRLCREQKRSAWLWKNHVSKSWDDHPPRYQDPQKLRRLCSTPAFWESESFLKELRPYLTVAPIQVVATQISLILNPADFPEGGNDESHFKRAYFSQMGWLIEPPTSNSWKGFFSFFTGLRPCGKLFS